MIINLSRRQVPNDSLLAVFSDVHIPIQDEAALRLAVEVSLGAGCTHVVLNGDVLDCGPVSRHVGKRARDVLRWGSLAESISPGRWFLDWAFSFPHWYLLGNHEAWVEIEQSTNPALASTTVRDMLGLNRRVRLLDSTSSLQLGSLNIQHGHGFWPRGSGGANPGARIKSLLPDQSTLVGHLHHDFQFLWTTRARRDHPAVRGAFGQGHLSLEHEHVEYAGKYPNWQQSWSLIRVYWDGEVPRFTITRPIIHRDRRGRPFCEAFGRVYR